MSRESIWTFLKTHTALPDTAVAGIMGNIEAESQCESCRFRGDATDGRLPSRTYAKLVNNGSISAEVFAADPKDWGLCQWGGKKRRLALHEFCMSRGKGIDDEETQIEFMLDEMQNHYPGLWLRLLTAGDVRAVTELVCRVYERPAVENMQYRLDWAQRIYNRFHGTPVSASGKKSVSGSLVKAFCRAVGAKLRRVLSIW